jgi:hypothetical protein
MPGLRHITLVMIYYEMWDQQQYTMYKVRKAILGRSILEFRGLKRHVLEMWGGYHNRLRGHREEVERLRWFLEQTTLLTVSTVELEGRTGLRFRIKR